MHDLENERQLFDRCVSLPAEQWDSFLETECADDPVLRARVRRMLDHYRETHSEESGFLRLDGSDPDRIGPYRILQRLGEGGMGIVYAAEQREPVRRRVAIKVLRGGYNNREVLARFDVERQALALMNHINIARIVDAGTTVDHRPYIVMEFVPGEPITRYCDHRNLSLRERLLMFCEVCDAVQHAHQRGVIHRDLKPSNILVMEEDGQPVPKIIDFGIAKAVTQRLTDQTLETKVGSLLGTPDYMSPEQAELSPLDIDTRADVYALGAVLYRLLTGVTPLELSASNMSYPEMQRLINEKIPAPPSSRLNGPLQRVVRGELDWIAGKALEKQRNHRYASAIELARDVHAYLNDETVGAGPPSRMRRINKFARRHWLVVASACSILLVLTVSQILLVQKNRELQYERDRASREAEIATEATNFTAGLFRQAGPNVSGSRDTTARQLLDAGVQQLDQQSGSKAPDVQARLYEVAATAYRDLGVLEEAVRLLGIAAKLRKESIETDPGAYGETLLYLAQLNTLAGDTSRSTELTDEAIALYKQSPVVRESWPLSAHSAVAFQLDAQGRYDEAGEWLAAAINEYDLDQVDDEARSFAFAMLGRIRRSQGRFVEAGDLLLKAIDSERQRGTTQVARDAKAALAGLYTEIGDDSKAEALQRQLLEEKFGIFGEEHPEYANALNNLARTLEGRPEHHHEAEELYLRAIDINIRTIGRDHPYTMIMRNNLGNLYAMMGDWQRSHDVFKDDLARLDHQRDDDDWQIASAKRGLALALVHLGDATRAEQLLRQAASAFTARYGDDHWRTGTLKYALGLSLHAQNRNAEAREELQHAHRLLETSLGPAHSYTRAAENALVELRHTFSPDGEYDE